MCVLRGHLKKAIILMISTPIIHHKRTYYNNYEEVHTHSHTVSGKNDLELQPNPAYGTSNKVIMDINPAYASCK